MSRRMTLPELERLMTRTRERAEAAYREKRPVEAVGLLADLAKLELEYGVRVQDPNVFSLLHAERSFQEAVTIARALGPDHKDAAKAGFPVDKTSTEALVDRLEMAALPRAAEAVKTANYVAAAAILLDAYLGVLGKTDPAPPE